MEKQVAQLSQIPLFSVNIPQGVDIPFLQTLYSGYIGQGKKVDEFEEILAKYFGNKNVLTLNSGTSALFLAMKLANLEEDDEIITTPMTCLATNSNIPIFKSKIVWADVNPDTGLIDPLDIERKITLKTKLIIGVDWGGTPCDWDRIMAIGDKYGIKVLEDAAHAFGAEYKGRKIGTLADFTIFSLQAIKHITTIDGGILITKNSSDYRRGKLLRWYGIDRETDKRDSRIEEDVPEVGFKLHMNDACATIGIEQMRQVDQVVGRHREIAEMYSQMIDQDKLSIALPHRLSGYDFESSFWLYTILMPDTKIRQKFQDFMKTKNIMVSQVHRRNDTHSAFYKFTKVLPGVDEFSDRMVCIPINFKMTNDDAGRVIKACNEFSAMI